VTWAPLVDPYGRTVADLRISVTDRCNLRCRYCMPEEGMQWLPREDLLSFEEIERVARVCVTRFGLRSIRLTGGEPTVRADLPVLVAMLAGLSGPAGPVNVALSTNGVSLRLLADDLVAAGVSRVNISCDSLRADRFAQMTGRPALARVLDGIDAALAAGMAPVKLNCVLMRGVNDDEILDFAAFGRRLGVGVRFIEFMPLDADGAWGMGTVVPSAEVVAAIDAVHPLVPVARGTAPASVYRYADGGGEIGVIASVTQSFCATCDRVRLTADGKFRNCLFAIDETDLRAILRGGGPPAAVDDALAEAVAADVGRKWAGHSIGQVAFIRPSRSMSQIGG